MWMQDCDQCALDKLGGLQTWMQHLTEKHAIPTEWPSDRAARLTGSNALRPYTTITESKKKRRKDSIPRPLNSFMLFAQHIRRNVLRIFSDASNSVISQQLGDLWRTVSRTCRNQYDDEANRLVKIHQIEFPNYKYQPKKRSPISNTNTNTNNNTTNNNNISNSSSNNLVINSQNNSNLMSNVSSAPMGHCHLNAINNTIHLNDPMNGVNSNLNQPMGEDYSPAICLSTCARVLHGTNPNYSYGQIDKYSTYLPHQTTSLASSLSLSSSPISSSLSSSSSSILSSSLTLANGQNQMSNGFQAKKHLVNVTHSSLDYDAIVHTNGTNTLLHNHNNNNAYSEQLLSNPSQHLNLTKAHSNIVYTKIEPRVFMKTTTNANLNLTNHHRLVGSDSICTQKTHLSSVLPPLLTSDHIGNILNNHANNNNNCTSNSNGNHFITTVINSGSNDHYSNGICDSAYGSGINSSSSSSASSPALTELLSPAKSLSTSSISILSSPSIVFLSSNINQNNGNIIINSNNTNTTTTHNNNNNNNHHHHNHSSISSNGNHGGNHGHKKMSPIPRKIQFIPIRPQSQHIPFVQQNRPIRQRYLSATNGGGGSNPPLAPVNGRNLENMLNSQPKLGSNGTYLSSSAIHDLFKPNNNNNKATTKMFIPESDLTSKDLSDPVCVHLDLDSESWNHHHHHHHHIMANGRVRDGLILTLPPGTAFVQTNNDLARIPVESLTSEFHSRRILVANRSNPKPIQFVQPMKFVNIVPKQLEQQHQHHYQYQQQQQTFGIREYCSNSSYSSNSSPNSVLSGDVFLPVSHSVESMDASNVYTQVYDEKDDEEDMETSEETKEHNGGCTFARMMNKSSALFLLNDSNVTSGPNSSCMPLSNVCLGQFSQLNDPLMLQSVSPRLDPFGIHSNTPQTNICDHHDEDECDDLTVVTHSTHPVDSVDGGGSNPSNTTGADHADDTDQFETSFDAMMNSIDITTFLPETFPTSGTDDFNTSSDMMMDYHEHSPNPIDFEELIIKTEPNCVDEYALHENHAMVYGKNSFGNFDCLNRNNNTSATIHHIGTDAIQRTIHRPVATTTTTIANIFNNNNNNYNTNNGSSNNTNCKIEFIDCPQSDQSLVQFSSKQSGTTLTSALFRVNSLHEFMNADTISLPQPASPLLSSTSYTSTLADLDSIDKSSLFIIKPDWTVPVYN